MRTAGQLNNCTESSCNDNYTAVWSLATQSVVCTPATLAIAGTLLEVQTHQPLPSPTESVCSLTRSSDDLLVYEQESL